MLSGPGDHFTLVYDKEAFYSLYPPGSQKNWIIHSQITARQSEGGGITLWFSAFREQLLLLISLTSSELVTVKEAFMYGAMMLASFTTHRDVT